MLDTNQIFAAALGINNPWFIESVDFSESAKTLEIKLDFKKGSKFPFINADGSIESCTAYDTVEKKWRHLNFFQILKLSNLNLKSMEALNMRETFQQIYHA
jgi:hypothetical protein